MPKTVAVVESFNRSMHDVREHAEQRFQEQVQTYRRGVEAMGRTGGTLPPDEADDLVAAATALGISPDRMADDAAVFISIANIQSRVEAIEARNAERRAPLPRLHATLDAAKEEWARVRVECEHRLAAAQAAVTAAERALAAVANQRDERADDDLAQIRRLHERNPHLFGALSADELRRFLTPSQRMRVL